jgi:hypothetical protein
MSAREEPLRSPQAGEGHDSVRDDDEAPIAFRKTHPIYVKLIEAHVFRLLELSKGAPGDKIVVRLSIHELEHAPEYEAISYVWGDAEPTKEIECNGKTLNITVNLHAAFQRIRLGDRPRILWADAICINQKDPDERSHHVAFMNIVYKQAKRVLVYMGKDPDGGANNVATLVQEHVKRMTGYKTITEMPVIESDPLLDDHRWSSLKTLMKNKWFKRAWVMQEVGVATEPVVLYGDAEFSYRKLVLLMRWIVRCAPQLKNRPGIPVLTIHSDWEYWTEGWKDRHEYKLGLLDFLSAAKGLGCGDSRDHVYAFLGHPLTQNEDGSPIIQPDYKKNKIQVLRQLSEYMLPKLGPRVLSAVEHDPDTIEEDVPSWVVRWDMDIIWNSMGYYEGFYYLAGCVEHDLELKGDDVLISGTAAGGVKKVHQFSKNEEDWPECEALEALQKVGFNLSIDTDDMDALSLTLCAGLTNYARAEDDLEQHRKNFASFWSMREDLVSRNESEPEADAFWSDVLLSCKGRSFFVTETGRFGLGPWIMKPGDECWVVKGGRVPLVLRKADAVYKLIGEAYLHGIMQGELLKRLDESGGWTKLVLR